MIQKITFGMEISFISPIGLKNEAVKVTVIMLPTTK